MQADDFWYSKKKFNWCTLVHILVQCILNNLEKCQTISEKAHKHCSRFYHFFLRSQPSCTKWMLSHIKLWNPRYFIEFEKLDKFKYTILQYWQNVLCTVGVLFKACVLFIARQFLPGFFLHLEIKIFNFIVKTLK